MGADGIRSAVRRSMYDSASPEDDGALKYLGTFVALGICSMPSASDILDGRTVVQVSDGSTRFYAMPYSQEEYMWQLSFPAGEAEAREMKDKVLEVAREKVRGWHTGAGLVDATEPGRVSGYGVYDRDPRDDFRGRCRSERVTVIGDAAHPMSPFKGQGANQALIDALELARHLKVYFDSGQGSQLRLGDFERAMGERSRGKVMKSREACEFLHSELVLKEGDVTRGGMNDIVNSTKVS